MSEVERFFIPTKPTLIEVFRAFRTYLERSFQAKGKALDPAWYDDGPESLPHLYKDQPEVLAAINRNPSSEGETDELRPT